MQLFLLIFIGKAKQFALSIRTKVMQSARQLPERVSYFSLLKIFHKCNQSNSNTIIADLK